MSGTTTAWAIPYATDDDVFCEGYETIDDMASRIDDLLEQFTVDLNRSVTIPYASISTVTPQSYAIVAGVFSTPGLTVDYDTVNAETGDYTNLAQVPAAINIPSDIPGYYAAGFYAQQITQDSTGADALTNITEYNTHTSQGNFIGSVQYDNITNLTMSATFFAQVPVTATTGDIQLISLANGTGSLSGPTVVPAANLYMFWVSDL